MCKNGKGKSSSQEIDDGSASASCAKEALRETLQRRGIDFSDEVKKERILQSNFRKEDEIHEGALESESLSAFTETTFGGKEFDKIDVPKWPIAKWRALRISAVVIDLDSEFIYDVCAIVVVAKCDYGKLPDYIQPDLTRGHILGWAPVFVGFCCNSDIIRKNDFDHAYKFKCKILKCGVLDFSPEAVGITIEE